MTKFVCFAAVDSKTVGSGEHRLRAGGGSLYIPAGALHQTSKVEFKVQKLPEGMRKVTGKGQTVEFVRVGRCQVSGLVPDDDDDDDDGADNDGADPPMIFTSYSLEGSPVPFVRVPEALNEGYRRLYIRLHYRCDPMGNPTKLMIVVAAGDPPRLDEEDDKQDDGLYTAHIVHGPRYLYGEFVASTSNLTLGIQQLVRSSIKLPKKAYSFFLTPRSPSFRRAIAMPSVDRSTLNSKAQWEISLDITSATNTDVIGGNLVFTVQQQVGKMLKN